MQETSGYPFIPTVVTFGCEGKLIGYVPEWGKDTLALWEGDAAWEPLGPTFMIEELNLQGVIETGPFGAYIRQVCLALWKVASDDTMPSTLRIEVTRDPARVEEMLSWPSWPTW